MLYLNYAKARAVVYIVGCIFHVCCWFGVRLGCEDEQSFAVRVTAAGHGCQRSRNPQACSLSTSFCGDVYKNLVRCLPSAGSQEISAGVL